MDKLKTMNIFSTLSLYSSSDLDEEVEELRVVQKSSGTKASKKPTLKAESKASVEKPNCTTGKSEAENWKFEKHHEVLQTNGLVNENESADCKKKKRKKKKGSATEGHDKVVLAEGQNKAITAINESKSVLPEGKDTEASSRKGEFGSVLPNARNAEEVVPRKNVADSSEPGSYLRWPLVWIDLEMTGLDLEKDRILEIACIITDGRLVKMIEGPDLIINQPEELLTNMGEWCQAHHTANGLVEGVRRSQVTEQEAEKQILEFVCEHTGPVQPLLAGNSVYVDFMFLRKYMPNLAAVFSHVVVDVSSIKALCLRWFPKDAERAPVKKKQHRALEDIKESIAELKFMQKAIFKDNRR